MAREMKDSGIEWIGEIPKEWEKISFKYLHNGLNTGEAIDKENWSKCENDTVFYTAGLEPIHTTYTDFPADKYTGKNDLLLARNGTPYVYLPVAAACYTDHIIRAKIKETSNRYFIRYCLQQSISSVVVDTVSIPTWSASIWNEQTIPYPPLPEQQRIADFLDKKCAEIDSVISQTEKTIEEYKALKQSVITEAVTKGVRGSRPMKDSGIEWIGEIPEEWEVIISRFVIDNIGDVDHYMPNSVKSGIPYIMTGDLRENLSSIDISNCKQISEEDFEALSKKITPQHGDIIFARYATIGTICYVDCNIDCVVSYSCVTVQPNKEILLGKFLYYYFKSNTFLEEIKQFITSNTQSNIGIEALYKAKVVVPVYNEQQEIADFLDKKCAEIDKLIEAKQQLLTEMESYKKSVIYEYVTGKKEV